MTTYSYPVQLFGFSRFLLLFQPIDVSVQSALPAQVVAVAVRNGAVLPESFNSDRELVLDAPRLPARDVVLQQQHGERLQQMQDLSFIS